MKISLWNWPSVKGVSEYSLQRSHGRLVCVNRQRSAAQVTKAPAVIESHDVICVRVRINDGVQPPDLFAQALNTKLRCGIDDHLRFGTLDVNGRPRAVIFRIGQKLGRVFLADNGNAL